MFTLPNPLPQPGAADLRRLRHHPGDVDPAHAAASRVRRHASPSCTTPSRRTTRSTPTSSPTCRPTSRAPASTPSPATGAFYSTEELARILPDVRRRRHLGLRAGRPHRDGPGDVRREPAAARRVLQDLHPQPGRRRRGTHPLRPRRPGVREHRRHPARAGRGPGAEAGVRLPDGHLLLLRLHARPRAPSATSSPARSPPSPTRTSASASPPRSATASSTSDPHARPDSSAHPRAKPTHQTNRQRSTEHALHAHPRAARGVRHGARRDPPARRRRPRPGRRRLHPRHRQGPARLRGRRPRAVLPAARPGRWPSRA